MGQRRSRRDAGPEESKCRGVNTQKHHWAHRAALPSLRHSRFVLPPWPPLAPWCALPPALPAPCVLRPAAPLPLPPPRVPLWLCPPPAPLRASLPMHCVRPDGSAFLCHGPLSLGSPAHRCLVTPCFREFHVFLSTSTPLSLSLFGHKRKQHGKQCRQTTRREAQGGMGGMSSYARMA